MTTADWTFSTLGHVWEYRTGAIVAGGDKLDALSGMERTLSLAALNQRVLAMIERLDDGWLATVGFWMVEDIYKSFFRDFVWSPGVHDYLVATAEPVVDEIARRGFALHYIVDATQPDENLATMLAHLPAVFQAAGLAVVGPQLIAVELLQRAEGHPPPDMASIQRYRADGYAIANEVITRWYDEGKSSVYLNLDRDDELPGFNLEVALSASDRPRAITVFRNTPPAEESEAFFAPPTGVVMPPGVPQRSKG